MINVDNWGEISNKYMEYWNLENHDRPLMRICAPKDGYTPKKLFEPKNIDDRWLDIEYVIKKSYEKLKATYYAGESFPNFMPNLGPDIFGATLGCDIKFEENTSYAIPFVHDWNNFKVDFHESNYWWKKIVELTKAAVDESNGNYLVSITDLHPGADALVSLSGPENLCMDLYDNKKVIQKVLFDILEIFKKQLDELHLICSKKLPGCTNWSGIWNSEKWYITSADFICMISNEMFKDIFLPELAAEFSYLEGRTIFHLDGPGALKHLDALLETPYCAGIQWVYGAGQPSAKFWIPVLKRIQDAGKLIHVYIKPDDIDDLLEHLKPEGVLYDLYCSTEEDAKAIMKKVESSYIKKIY